MTYFRESGDVIRSLESQAETIRRMAVGIEESVRSGGKVLVGGNGGSAADAEHFAGELTCTFKNRDRPGFAAVSLTSSASAITAWANDFGFDTYFKRQVEALGRPRDILFLISTGGGDRNNGASMNLVSAAETALEKGLTLYVIAGKSGGELQKMAHEFVKVPSFITSHIQEAHIVVIHAICQLLDDFETAGKEGG